MMQAKRWVAILMALSMILSITPTVFAIDPYCDITEDSSKLILSNGDGASESSFSDFPTLEEVIEPENQVPFDQQYPDLINDGIIDFNGDRLMVKFEDTPSLILQGRLYLKGITKLEKLFDAVNGVWYLAHTNSNVTDVLAKVREIDEVMVAEYDYIYTADAAIVDSAEIDAEVLGNSQVNDQWYLRSCGIQNGLGHLKHHHHHHHDKDGNCKEDEAGDENIGIAGEGIVVAVIDTGVDYNHEDLKDNIWVNVYETPDDDIDNDGNGYVDDYYGYNAVADGGSALDDNGHGTHVAGIIAATNNDLGVVGIAYNATVMPVKAGMSSGYFSQSDIAEAIVYAYMNGADVINMSFGGSASSIAVEDALALAYTNCLLVAAAGNDGENNEPVLGDPTYLPNYPAAYAYVLGVMSVDENGVESSFTNYDVKAFNSVEYELYAPGESMLSTIPNNKYAAWSGTSMAAPVVAAMAALVRAQYYDRDMYPTKFVAGQLASTGDALATCNGPKIVNLENALNDLPQPDVGVSDYVFFDTLDIEGNSKNNGDGIIDAGETIALGFELRNRWGKTGETIVSIDTLTQGGMTDPYVTIHNPSVDYGEIGTYSTKNAGWIEDEDNVIIGIENPLYLTIDGDCPDDYIVELNVTVTSTNGLDEEDENVYISNDSIKLEIRRGTVLPNIIKEDMTLTKDEMYIIPNSTLIIEGVTVTVQPGTQIQFWSDDPNDAYASTAIVSLDVQGTLLLEGTPENPIELFPSEGMSRYPVEIAECNNGMVIMQYTSVVNPYLTGTTYAEGCEFTQNYRGELLSYRKLNGTLVNTWLTYGKIEIDYAKDCAFYKLGGTDSVGTDLNFKYDNYELYGIYDGCIFVDCAIRENALRAPNLVNCVLYGNNNYMDEAEGSVSTIPVYAGQTSWSCELGLQTDPKTGTSYVDIYTSSYSSAEDFANRLGGHLAIIETEAELAFLASTYNFGCRVGMIWDVQTQSASWTDGAEVGDFIILEAPGPSALYFSHTSHLDFTTGIVSWSEDSTYGRYLIELPSIYVEEAPTTITELVETSQRYDREYWTTEKVAKAWEDYRVNGINPYFHNNAVLNRLNREDKIEAEWLRITGASSSKHEEISIAGNYWGTTSPTLINHQIMDFDDNVRLIDLNEVEYLTAAPENVWPFVTNAWLTDGKGNVTDVVGNEKVFFYVTFNRDMDTSIPLNVWFGSAYPYVDYAVVGSYVDARTWKGEMTLNTLIEGGYHCFSISNGRAADETHKILYKDWGRFPFQIDGATANAMNLQGNATAEGIQLTWMQDDYTPAIMAGYNIYRAEGSADGQYIRINPTIIPVGETTFLDDTVEPSTDYYYSFTVVLTGGSTDGANESTPSGKVRVKSKDTVPPSVTHTPVSAAIPGRNLTISATVTDNLGVEKVSLFYRVVGVTQWKEKKMSNLNDKYSAIISANEVTTAGIEYYISASDGVSIVTKGSASVPYTIAVRNPDDPVVTVSGNTALLKAKLPAGAKILVAAYSSQRQMLSCNFYFWSESELTFLIPEGDIIRVMILNSEWVPLYPAIPVQN